MIKPDWWTSGPFAGGRGSELVLRRDAGRILAAAVAAVDPARLVRAALRAWHLEDRAVHVLAIGKAAHGMVRGTLDALPVPPASGLMVTLASPAPAPAGFDLIVGGHPVPDSASARAGQRVARFARNVPEGDIVIALISGGGSALVTLPPAGLTLDDVRVVTDVLLRAGATIESLNAVRKHLDDLKGGRLARLLAPTHTIALAISDVPGDAPGVIASGPLSPDATTFGDAIDVLRSFGAWADAPAPVRTHLDRGARGEIPDSPDAGDPCFARVDYVIAGSARDAAEAARAEAATIGYVAQILTLTLTGDARSAGAWVASVAHGPEPAARTAAITAGETTVRVTGDGRGGRNQEVALAAAVVIEGQHALVASIGTDGIDGPTDAAGALATGSTMSRAHALDLDAQDALRRNDAYPFFDALHDLIRTGPTGTNVSDLQLVLRGSDPRCQFRSIR
jgi:hydroxypyruvate reductase